MSDSNPIKALIQREPDCKDLPLPNYATLGSVGMDLRAAIKEEVVLAPGERAMISTGIRLALPEGFEAQVRPRSGLAYRYGIGMVNAPGTIDPDYRGVVSVLLINHGQDPFTLQRGDRIAQLVIAPVVKVNWLETAALPETDRGEGGFGHTGTE